MGQNSRHRIISMMKPEIALLLDLVAIAGFFIGLNNINKLYLLIPLLISGSFASFSASLLNGVIEAKSDEHMQRTSWRKASEIKSIIIFIALILLGISILVSLELINIYTTLWIISGFLSYVFLYTIILKRRTYWNIVIGGISGSFPALAGWSTVNSAISIYSLYIGFLIFLWTPVHFWALATKYKDDYKLAGIPMLPSIKSPDKVATAILLTAIILIFYSMIPLIFPNIIRFGIIYDYALVISTLMLAINIIRYKMEPMKNAIRLFGSSNIYIMILMLGIILSRFYP